MSNRLVTLLSPCYNKADALHRFMDSVIAQTYRPIELIVVDDGSTDNSSDILLAYTDRMKEADIDYRYVRQENGGVGAAINTGLPLVHGDYLCWPDIDDWYEPEATEKKVRFLEEHPEFAAVTSAANVVSVNDLSNRISVIGKNDDCCSETNQFRSILEGTAIVTCICYMVHTAALFDALGGKEIFPSRFGQNLQILYPLFYKYKCGHLPDALGNYVIYEDSLSHYAKTFESSMREREGRFEIKLETIKRIPNMPAEARQVALDIVTKKEARMLLRLSAEYRQKDLAKRQKAVLVEKGVWNEENRKLYLRATSWFYRCLNDAQLTVKEFLYAIKQKALKQER